jgi:hypothetical protein
MKNKKFKTLSETYNLVIEQQNNQNNLDLIYQVITDPNESEPFPMDKAFIIKNSNNPEDAKTFLNSMTPEQSHSEVNVYGVEASKKYLNKNLYSKIFGGGSTIAATLPDGIFFGENVRKQPKEEVINTLRHELQHAIDRKFYPYNKTDYDNNPPVIPVANSPRAKSVAKTTNNSNYDPEHSSYKDYLSSFISPEEIRGRIAESRNFLGAITTPEQFKQKWDIAEQEFSNAVIKEWLSENVTKFKTPIGFRQLIYVYDQYITDPIEKQKLYNYILRTALDNSVAKNSNNNPEEVA